MTFKTILVHLHDSARAHRLLEAAVPLVRSFDAHLIGLCVLPPFVPLPYMDPIGASLDVEAHREVYKAEMARLKDIFAEVTRGQGLRAEWREADAGVMPAADTVIEHARCVDLVVASQQNPGWAFANMLEEPERVAIECGRPVLIVPNKGSVAMPPTRITVAWNGRREATRAVFNALPFLKRSGHDVTVVWINAESDQPLAGDLPGAEICASLARHGVKCLVLQASAADRDVGEELLRQASISGSGLLVMGCYGHARMREFILGGASRTVLQRTNVPVLMSH